MVHHVGAALAILALLAHGSRSTPLQQVPLERYRTIVHEYRTADKDRAIASLRTWREGNPDSLELIVADVARSGVPGDIAGLAFLLASGMLHSDAAVDAERSDHISALTFHLQAADRLLESADRIRDTGFRRRWLLALGLYLLDRVRFDTVQHFLSRACDTFPDDARLQLACGLMNATHGTLLRFIIENDSTDRLGSELLRRELAVRRDAPTTQRHLLARREAALAVAARHFQKAIDVDPGLIEARLRLAHIHTITGRDKTAEPALSELAALPLPPQLAYTSRLLLGGIAERRGDFAAAATWYRRAGESLPRTQSALVGLAHVLFTAGDRNGSRAVIDELFGARLRDDDPWTRYPWTFLATPTDSLEDLHREALR